MQRHKYTRPKIEVIEVCFEGAIMEPSKWGVGEDPPKDIHEGNPPGAKENPESIRNLWDDEDSEW